MSDVKQYDFYVSNDRSKAQCDPYIMVPQGATGRQTVLSFGPQGNQPNTFFMHVTVDMSVVYQKMSRLSFEDLEPPAQADILTYLEQEDKE